MTHSVRRSLSRSLAMLLAGAAAVTFVACGGATAADGSAATAAPVQVAQADTSAAPKVKAPEPSGSVDVKKLMAAEALPDVVIGKADAPVTIVEYASMTCPHCADFHSETYPVIKKEFIDTGKAKLILREFPFDPRALAAFMLARCTGSDQRRTAMVDVLFDQQNEWAHSDNASAALLKIARLAGMSEADFKACLNNKKLQQQVVDVQQRGEKVFGVDATPTFFVNGDKYAGALSPEEMSAVIQKHL
ncbi:DsbA family protein [Jiella sp. M17.18]|uniref:DsbA family protein n=1 Tax=Jiella sp. M17.18 TaxID=3234247 RepID=UPI0034DFDC58